MLACTFHLFRIWPCTHRQMRVAARKASASSDPILLTRTTADAELRLLVGKPNHYISEFRPNALFGGTPSRKALKGLHRLSPFAAIGKLILTRGESQPIFVNKITSIKAPLEMSRFSRRKKNRMARGSPPLTTPSAAPCSHVRTASTQKFAIARDDCVHHVLPIPLGVESSIGSTSRLKCSNTIFMFRFLGLLHGPDAGIRRGAEPSSGAVNSGLDGGRRDLPAPVPARSTTRHYLPLF